MSELFENEPPVKVAVRQRPINSIDYSEMIIKYEPKSSNIIIVDDRPYIFDQVFGPSVEQQQLFEEAIKPLVEKVLKGFNCTTLAYGQTGTGKSYTMGLSEESDEKHAGIVRRCLKQIMKSDLNQYDIKASFVEIYNERVFDLLSANPTEPIMSKGFKYPGGTRLPIFSMADCNEILRQGVSKRHVRPTNMNTQSSRSHVIFTIEVISKDNFRPSRAFLNIVDLAGSEGVRRTGHTGQAMSEGVNINQGLLCIGKILQAMSEGKKVIPFRDSVLGAVLQDSLNPNSYLTLLACISPKRIDLSETLSTIRFAQRAKQLKLTPQMNFLMTELNKNKSKTPYNTKATTFVKPLKTPFKRSATENEIANTFCTPAKERRIENHLNHTDIGLTPKEKDKAQKQLENAATTNFVFPRPIARSSTVHSTAQRESLFEQTIDSWALNASTSTLSTFEAPSCAEKPISYSPIVEKCMEKFSSVFEDKIKKLMVGFMHEGMQLQTPAQQNNMQNFPQTTMRSELKSLLNEMMLEQSNSKTPINRPEDCSSPPRNSARCQLFTTSSPVFKVPKLPPNSKTNFSTQQILDDTNGIDYSMTDNTVRPARRSTRLQSKTLDDSQLLSSWASNTNQNKIVRRSTRLQELITPAECSIQRHSEDTEKNRTLRRSTRRRSSSAPVRKTHNESMSEKSATKANKNNKKNSICNNLFANFCNASSKTTNIAKYRKAFLELLNQGSMKELQVLPQIGLKTAYQLVTHRTLNGKFKNLTQVESLPMWRGNGWERFAQANMLI